MIARRAWFERQGRVVYRVFVQLVDADTDDRNPYGEQPNLNKGNRQIAHGIDRVLRPIDL